MRKLIYEPTAYPSAKIIPMNTWEEYQEEINSYIDNYVAKSESHGKYFKKLTSIWVKLVGMKKFTQGINPTTEACRHYFKSHDEATGYSDSLVSICYSILLKDHKKPVNMEERAASLICATMDFYQDFKSGQLPADKYKEDFLEMGQYANLFGTSLRPGKVDTVYKTQNQDYIIIVLGGEYFKLDLGDGPVNFEEIKNALKEVVKGSSTSGLSYLSLLPRAQVYKTFKKLEIKDRASLETLYNAFFVVCLDADKSPKDLESASLKLYTGNLRNRWFPASLQIVVFKNGKAGFVLNNRNYVDGNIGSRFASEVQQRSLKIENVPANKKLSVTPIKFHLDKKEIEKAKEQVSNFVCKEQVFFEMKGIGSNDFRSKGINPATAFELALAAAALKLSKRQLKVLQLLICNIFESHGLAYGYIATQESKDFSTYINRPNWENKKAKEYFLKACDAHKLAQRKGRKGMSFFPILDMFIMQASLWQKFLTGILFLLGGDFSHKTDAMTSHPLYLPEIASFGRPGALLPYLKEFGLHYLIHQDRIELIYMPSPHTTFNYPELTKEIENRLKDILMFSKSNESTAEEAENIKVETNPVRA
jgi:hypothetical protein